MSSKLTLDCLQWGNCTLGISDVWDERNGLLWAQPFEIVDYRLVRASINNSALPQTPNACRRITHRR